MLEGVRRHTVLAAICVVASLPRLAGAGPHRWRPAVGVLDTNAAGAMVYDSVRRRIVMLGGTPVYAYVNDTWEYDGASWTRRAPIPPGLSRQETALAYDPGRERVFLFGGWYGSYLADTWSYDGAAWSMISTTASPPARGGHGMTFDTRRSVTVMFGGYTADSTPWLFDGRSWTPSTPAPAILQGRYAHAMAFDATRGKTVVFGGRGVGGSYYQDVWEFDGNAWSPGPTPPPGLTPRESAAMAFDVISGTILLVGGYDGASWKDAWRYDGAAWTPGPTLPASAPGRFRHAMAFDAGRGAMVLFGGHTYETSSRDLNDTWELQGTTWVAGPTAPPSMEVRRSHAMAFDRSRGVVVLFGGVAGLCYSDTWEYDGSTWRAGGAAPAGLSARAGHGLVFDSRSAKLVLFGGNACGVGYLNDTWEYDGSWANGPAAPAALAPRHEHAMAFDSWRGRTVLFGGSGATTYKDTWEYDGTTWVAGPPAPAGLTERTRLAMAFDSRRGRSVLHGGSLLSGGTNSNETWEYDGTQWFPGLAAPSASVSHAMTFDEARGRVVVFGGYESGSYPYGKDDTWEYDGSAWLPGPQAPAGLLARSLHAMAYDSARGVHVLFGGAAAIPYGLVRDTWEYGRGTDDILAGGSLASSSPPHVRIFAPGAPGASVDILAYDVAGWGANVGSGQLDGATDDEILTGPGPGIGYGPVVRGFESDGAPIWNVLFNAYGTIQYGVNVAGAKLDGDAFAEILSGPGGGAVFGPHVRGWNYDNAAVAAMPKVSFYAYGTLKYGVNVARGDVEGDGYQEILTAPGPGVVFSPQIRGFDVDGGPVAAISRINFNAFGTPRYGANVASGSVDADVYDEMACAVGPGPGAAFPSQFRGFGYDATSVAALPGFDVTAFSTTYGGRVGLGDVGGTEPADLISGAGPDWSADSTVKAYVYDGARLAPAGAPFLAFPGTRFGVNVAGATLGY